MPNPYNIDHDNCFVKCIGYLNLSVQKKILVFRIEKKKTGGKLVCMSWK